MIMAFGCYFPSFFRITHPIKILNSLLYGVESRSYIEIHIHLFRLLILGRLYLKAQPVQFLPAHAYAMLGYHPGFQSLQLEQDVGNDILKVDVSIRLGNHEGVILVVSNV